MRLQDRLTNWLRLEPLLWGCCVIINSGTCHRPGMEAVVASVVAHDQFDGGAETLDLPNDTAVRHRH